MEQHHERFRQLTKTDAGNWGIGEHWQLCQFLKFAGEIDQLDLTNLAWAETAFRTLQCVEFVHREAMVERDSAAAGSRLTIEERSAFSGAVRPGDQLMVCPALLEHVRERTEREGKLLKSLRLAREEREHRRGGQKQ